MKLHRYVEQQRLHITTKDRHSYLSSSWVIRPWFIWKMFLTCSSFTIWNIWMKLQRYVDHQRLHIVTKDVISLSISVLLLFRHYISHKITFGAPSSGGVLCSACGAFILIWSLWRQQHTGLSFLVGSVTLYSDLCLSPLQFWRYVKLFVVIIEMFWSDIDTFFCFGAKSPVVSIVRHICKLNSNTQVFRYYIFKTKHELIMFMCIF